MTSTTHQRPELISVILSTYNAPEWLEKTLWGYQRQTHTSFEIVIADDGSGPQTKDLIQRIAAESSLPIQHVWHVDDGFRKCTILNRAISAARGDYLLFSDGDCIPRADLLLQHYQAAQPGRFLSGGYFKLPMNVSQRISQEDIFTGHAFQPRWLFAAGLRPSLKSIRLVTSGRFASVMNHLTTTRPTWNGHNASGWASDIIQAGGFDERMRYGGEDRELGERLENAGIQGKHVRYQTLCLHLDHSRGYVNTTDLDRNREIRAETRRLGRTRTSHGLNRAA